MEVEVSRKVIHWDFAGVEDRWIPCGLKRSQDLEMTENKKAVTCKKCLKVVAAYPGVDDDMQRGGGDCPCGSGGDCR